ISFQGEVEEIELQNKNLRQENEELKGTCASLQKQNIHLQEELQRKQELQNSLESLRSSKETLEQELNSLKKENAHLQELDECRVAELQQLKEQIQNVTSEKEHLENRLKTALDHMDQLQSQVLDYEKEMENLSQLDCDKTKQLESLKEENRELRVTGTQQQQNQDLMKELEEQKHLLQILQAKKTEADEKNQKLREENDELLRHLSQTTVVSSFSQAAVPAPGAGGLLFGNPYCAFKLTLFVQVSLRKCPMCDEVFPEAVGTEQYQAHVQSHLLECPLCSETFDKSNKQVFDDHVFCHGLE
ncbi:CACO2 protein, partial [Alcedo cyanopectus]|nr:CACO2 protein [Ceyx cyanopectus]